MARPSRSAAASLAALALTLAAAPAAARDRAGYNRAITPAHQPVVSRTDLSFDVAASPLGLAPGEPQRLAAWLDGLALGSGDTVTIANPQGWQADRAADGVAAVLSRYGMLLSSAPAPVNAGQPAPGAARVVVSRAIASVPGCPDWSRGNFADFDGTTTSNYGCATASNLAAMIANPQDLVRGAEGHPWSDAALTNKAVAAWRDAAPSGTKGLKTETTGGK